jgi:SAM-dependent methyltransferase
MALEDSPPIGRLDFGDLRRVTPISQSFGFDRGQPIDRYYIEGFLALHAEDIRGRVLEIADNHYTRQFGGSRVTRSDVLNLTPDNPHATIIADLANAGAIPSNAFDCIVFTQTLQYIYEPQTAVKTLYRILKPEGVLLASFPVISQICRYDMDRWGDYWRFTDGSIRRLLGDIFTPENVTVQAHGNILAAISFLHGLAAHELRPPELEHHDPDYQILITARAVKRVNT